MAADRFGQAVARTEKVDGCSLAVIVAKYRSLGLLFWRKRVVDTSNCSNLLLPGKFVSVILRKRSADEAAFGGLAVQGRMRLVTHERLERQNRKNERKDGRNADEQPRKTNRLESGAPFGMASIS